MGSRYTLSRKLLDHYPEKALDLLMDCLKDGELRTATEQYIGQQNSSPVGLHAAFEHQPRSSLAHSSRPGSSSIQRTTQQNTADVRHGLHSPPTSAASVKSHGSSLAGAGMERIYLVSSDDGRADLPVISRSASVKNSLIGDNVAYGRGHGASTEEVYEPVFVPLPNGGQRRETAIRAVTLTWRRRNEFKSNLNTFYIVPAKSLDCDVILGSHESPEYQYPSGIQEGHSPQARYPRGGFGEMEEGDPTILPQAPTAPMHSHQQTSISPNVQHTYDRVQAFRNTQRIYAAEPSTPAPHSRHIEREQSLHTTTPLAAQGPSSGQLQVVGSWDKTPIKMSFDPDASGEAFYQAFHQWAVKRKRDGDLDRHRTTLWLKGSKDMPDDQAYDLSLKEDEMDELWETAVDWMQENKSPKAPHLFVTVELEAG